MARLAWRRAGAVATTRDHSEAHLFQDCRSGAVRVPVAARAIEGSSKLSGPSALWAHGISGDLPIVLVRIDEPEDRGIVRQLLRAHEYWRMKGLAVDLVIVNEQGQSYVQQLQASLETLVRTSQSAVPRERPATHGRVFIVRKDLLSAQARDALHARPCRAPDTQERSRNSRAGPASGESSPPRHDAWRARAASTRRRPAPT